MHSYDIMSPRLTSAQARAVPALLSTNSMVEAAQVAGVSYATLRRWLQQPDFRAALQAAESELVDAAVRRLLNLQDKALQKLADLLDNPNTADPVSLRAAIAVMDMTMRLMEMRRFDERLNALERAAAEARMIDG